MEFAGAARMQSEAGASRGSRRSDRIELSVQLEVSGMDAQGQAFVEQVLTRDVSRHGAMLPLAQRLAPDQALTLRKPAGACIEVVVVGITEKEEGRFTYGVTFKDQAAEFWGIEFPPLTEADLAAARVLLECQSCAKRELAYLNEIETMVFHSNRCIHRACKACGASTLWERGEHDTWLGPRPATRKKGEEPPRVDRKHMRLKMRLEVCVRTLEHGEDVVHLDDISRGGFGFRSRVRYFRGQRVEAATNYHKGGPNIFVATRITFVGQPGVDGLIRYGAAYISEKEISFPAA